MKNLQVTRNIALCALLAMLAGPAFAVSIDIDEEIVHNNGSGTVELDTDEVNVTKQFTQFGPIDFGGSMFGDGTVAFSERITNNTAFAWDDYHIGLSYAPSDPCALIDSTTSCPHTMLIDGESPTTEFNGGEIDIVFTTPIAIGAFFDVNFDVVVVGDTNTHFFTLTQRPTRDSTPRIPEPTTVALMGIALAGFGVRRRKAG